MAPKKCLLAHAMQSLKRLDLSQKETMIELPYSLVIEATSEPDFFSFYSPDLEGFTGVGHSVEDCLYQAKWGMAEHVSLLEKEGLPVPVPSAHPRVVIENAAELKPS